MGDQYLTLQSVTALGPCHSAETIQAWYPGRKRVRLSTVLRDDRISAADRLWLAVRVLPSPVVSRWTDCVVERSIRRSLGTSGCPAWESWAACWLGGTDRTVGAADAAWAAWAAADAADRAAVAQGAGAGAGAEAWMAERDQQIGDLLEIICKNQGEKNA